MKCPLCQGEILAIDQEHYECAECKSQLWISEEVLSKRRLVKTAENEFFFLPHNQREILPSGPPKKSTGGGNRAGKKNKNKGTKKYVEPWE